MGKLVSVFGAKQTDISELSADIGAVTKLGGFATGDTLCSAGQVVTLDGVHIPSATYAMAVEVAKKGEEEKVASVSAVCVRRIRPCTLASITRPISKSSVAWASSTWMWRWPG